MQVSGKKQKFIWFCLAFLMLTLLFTYLLKPLTSDITPTVQLDKIGEILQKSLMGSQPTLDGVWRRVLADSSEFKSSPESLQKPLQKLKDHLLTELTGITHQTLMKNYIAQKPLVLPSWPAPLQIVIVTTWRSGSTFTEKLFDSHPAIMDAYEPLSHLNLRRARGTSAQDSQAIVRDLLQCRYTNVQYRQEIKKIPTMIDDAIRTFCTGPSNVCNDPQYLSLSCQLFPWILIKTVRLPLALMEPLLETPVSSNLQIIYLVRDPRAVINSRRSTVKWCKPSDKDCYLPSVLCEDMDQDFQAYLKFKKLYPDHIHLVRYEDMMNDPMSQTQSLVETVGLNFTQSMKKFVLSHSTKEVDKAWTTSRVSKKRLLYWSSKLSKHELHNVQIACAQTMAKFGYKIVSSAENLTLDDVLTNIEENL